MYSVYYSVYSITGSKTVYDPNQQCKNHIGNPCTIVKIQIQPSMWPHFWITSPLSNLALCTDTNNFCFILTGFSESVFEGLTVKAKVMNERGCNVSFIFDDMSIKQALFTMRIVIQLKGLKTLDSEVKQNTLQMMLLHL